MSDHAWCSDPARDEAVRAAEDNRQGPLPTLEEVIETARAMMPKSGSGSSAVEQENKGNGMRTERVTLEVKHACKYQAAEWVLDLVQEACSDPGESVRVVEEVRLPPTIIRLTDEREAARRERDEAKEECERLRAERDDALLVLPACCGRLYDAAETVVQERDHARSRVAELLKDCETYQRAVLALQGQCDLANVRVAELESASAPAANAGGVSHPEQISDDGKTNRQGKLDSSSEPVAWGVLIDSGRGLYGHYDFESEARGVCDAVNAEEGWAMTVVPLYAAPQPPRGWLTEKERGALERAFDLLCDDDGDQPLAGTVQRLLARSTPPRVEAEVFDEVSALRAEVALLREDRRWIPAGERLPELDSEVLVAWSHEGDKEQVVSQAWRNHLGKFVNLEDTEFFGVTHWRPLPAPPAGGEVE